MRNMNSEKDFRHWISLGREVTENHPIFKELAVLGNTYARERAAIEFYVWLKHNKKATVIEKLKKLTELLGKAEFLEHVKETTRLCLALGDTTKKEDVSGWTK